MRERKLALCRRILPLAGAIWVEKDAWRTFVTVKVVTPTFGGVEI
ncbi:MAG: hypothetical protein ACTS6P_00925 [Candidatus Hodgkinia cicadicola]